MRVGQLLTRRALVLTVAVIAQYGQRPALAAEDPLVAAAAVEVPLVRDLRLVTSRAKLMITIGNKPPREMLVGLYGETAPSSVALFNGLCAGTLPSVEFQSTLSYAGSTASRIEKDRVIVLGKLGAGTAQYIERSIDGTGYVRSELVNRADSFNTTDDGAAGVELPHDRRGLVSMRRAGTVKLLGCQREAVVPALWCLPNAAEATTGSL